MNRDSNEENFENQSPQRVTLIGRKRTFTGEYVGKFEDVSVYESAIMGVGSNSAGIALPGRGIVVGKGAFSQNLALDLVQHEYGHILQAKMFGKLAFFSTIAPESVISAALNRKFGHSHNSYWTETHANYLSSKYFDAEYIDKTIKYPVRHLSYFNFIRLTLASLFLRYIILIAFLISLMFIGCSETNVSSEVSQAEAPILSLDTIIGTRVIKNKISGEAYRSRANSYFIVVGSDTSFFQPVFIESKEDSIVGVDFHTSFVRKGLTHQQRILELKRIIPRAAIDYDLSELGGVYLRGLSSPPDLAIRMTQEYLLKVDTTFKDINDYQAFSEFMLDSQLAIELNEIFRPYGVEIEKFNLEKLRLVPKEQFLKWHKVESDTIEIPDKIIDCFVGASFKPK